MANEKAAELLAELAARVADLQTSEGWARWLEFQDRFHRYSFGNALLIARQRPDATQVAGFHKWLELGRHVRKGEHGIRILAPCVVKVDSDDPDGSEAERRVVGFRVATVFDVTQTDGEDLPEHPCHRLTGEAPERMRDALADLARSEGFTVQFGAELIAGRNGETSPTHRSIKIAGGLAPAQVVKTLAHEIGHALMHSAKILSEIDRPTAEVEAESVAYLVCKRIGLETEGYSFGYVTSWAHGTGRDAVAAIQASGQRIVKAAQRITDGIEEREPIAAAA